jgi:hypothetical protein
MPIYTSLLVSLVVRIDRFPWPPEPPHRRRGLPKTSAERLILKALVIRGQGVIPHSSIDTQAGWSKTGWP